MSEHTTPECAACAEPRSCCDPGHCKSAELYARDVWGVDLTPLRADHPELPYMGPSGCVVEPHLRPTCSLHTCDVARHGGKPHDQDWNNTYWDLRKQIDDLEFR